MRLLPIAMALSIFFLCATAQGASAEEKSARDTYNTCAFSERAEEIVDACTKVRGFPRLSDRFREAARIRRGLALSDLGRHKEALIDLAYATDPSVLYVRAHSYMALEHYDDALIDIEVVIQAVPQNPHVHNLKAWALFKLNETGGNVQKLFEALAGVNKAIDLKADFAEAYDTRAHLYEVMAREPGSQDDPDRASEVSGFLTSLEYISLAIDDYRKALELRPDLQESIEGLKRLGVELPK